MIGDVRLIHLASAALGAYALLAGASASAQGVKIDVIKADGGQVLGHVLYPLNAPDFSSFLLQAQSSKAKIVGLANGGTDTVNAIKQAAEFGIVAGGQRIAALLLTVADLHGLGLQAA